MNKLIFSFISGFLWTRKTKKISPGAYLGLGNYYKHLKGYTGRPGLTNFSHCRVEKPCKLLIALRLGEVTTLLGLGT